MTNKQHNVLRQRVRFSKGKIELQEARSFYVEALKRDRNNSILIDELHLLDALIANEG